MDQQYWLNRWIENRTGFHEKAVNPMLERFWPQIAPQGSGRVLVPFCGKSVDLPWLAARGHEVVGVDLSRLAALAFAEEQGVTFVETQQPPFSVFHGERITFYAGDFLLFARDLEGQFDFFYDRAAIIALPPEMRPLYAAHLEPLVAPGGRGLLISLEYDMSKGGGPPFTVTEGELRTLFPAFDVAKLLEYDCLDSEPRFKERGVEWMREIVYEIRRKELQA